MRIIVALRAGVIGAGWWRPRGLPVWIELRDASHLALRARTHKVQLLNLAASLLDLWLWWRKCHSRDKLDLHARAADDIYAKPQEASALCIARTARAFF